MHIYIYIYIYIPVDPFAWTSKSRTTNENLHTTVLCQYRCNLMTHWKQWTIEKGGGRGSRCNMMMMRYIYIYI